MSEVAESVTPRNITDGRDRCSCECHGINAERYASVHIELCCCPHRIRRAKNCVDCVAAAPAVDLSHAPTYPACCGSPDDEYLCLGCPDADDDHHDHAGVCAGKWPAGHRIEPVGDFGPNRWWLDRILGTYSAMRRRWAR